MSETGHDHGPHQFEGEMGGLHDISELDYTPTDEAIEAYENQRLLDMGLVPADRKKARKKKGEELRRDDDFYATPVWAIEILFGFLHAFDLPFEGSILEPCSGDGRIARAIRAEWKPDLPIKTNDINRAMPADTHLDAEALVRAEMALGVRWDHIITNPPFSEIDRMMLAFYEAMTTSLVLFARLSLKEPTQARGRFLELHPPDMEIVMQRIKFNGTSKDTVTSSWFVWDERLRSQGRQIMRIVASRAPHAERALLEA